MALPTGASSPTGSMNWTGSVVNVNSSNHQFQFGVKSQVGIDLPPTMLVDASAGQSPLIYEPSQGALVGITYPVAVTSQVVNFSVNVVWDEWVPILPSYALKGNGDMASQIAGNTIGNILEVEAGTKAARVTLRPEDYGALGIYSLAPSNGASAMAAGLAAASPIFSFRWGNASNLALIKRVVFSAGNGVTAFAAGIAKFDLIAARSFTVNDTGGVSVFLAAIKTSCVRPVWGRRC
jgi:hypothetical protein